MGYIIEDNIDENNHKRKLRNDVLTQLKTDLPSFKDEKKL